VLEIEVKIKVNDLNALPAKIIRHGAVLEKERFFEKNTLYDFRSQALLLRKQALRLRRIGKKVFLTYKGTPQKSRRFKIRREYETEVRNEKQIRRILEALGLVPVFHYEKHRTIFRKGQLKICLDELSTEKYIEFEGKREKIAQFSRLLGFNKSQWIKQDYIQILKKAGPPAEKA
jgi:adenylate cyclase class 2